MYTKNVTGQIIFYYAHKDLFEDVQHESAYMCKNLVTKEGEDLSEQFAITDDEQPMFALCLREALPAIYDKVKVLTHGINDALYDIITGTNLKNLDPALSTLVVDSSGNYVVIRVNNYGAYNPNDLKLVDSALQSSIEQGCLAEYYTRVLNKDLTEISAGNFAAQVMALALRVVPLRKKSVL